MRPGHDAPGRGNIAIHSRFLFHYFADDSRRHDIERVAGAAPLRNAFAAADTANSRPITSRLVRLASFTVLASAEALCCFWPMPLYTFLYLLSTEASTPHHRPSATSSTQINKIIKFWRRCAIYGCFRVVKYLAITRHYFWPSRDSPRASLPLVAPSMRAPRAHTMTAFDFL